MSGQSYRKSVPFFLVFLMLLAPFASANVTTFTNGGSDVEVEIRDGNDLSNLNDGMISLPDGETVTGATMKISTAMVEHSAHSRIDLETMPNGNVWNPLENNQLTAFSDISLFKIEDSNGDATPVSLAAEGFLTDFEGTSAGFVVDFNSPGPTSGANWAHGTLTNSNVPTACKSGAECWGTNIGDDNYTDDDGASAFDMALLSPSMYVEPTLKSKTAFFDSWHNLETINGGGQNTYRYQDCAYLEIRSSNNPLTQGSPELFQYLPIDIQNSVGIGYGQGYAQRQNSAQDNRVHPSCGGLNNNSQNEYGLAGTSVSSTNPTGWATVAVDLTDFIGFHVQMRFVMEHNGLSGANVDDNMSGWQIDNFRLGDLLPQNGSMTVRGITPSSLGSDNHPNGYGLVTLEAETSASAQLTVDVLDTNNQVVTGKDGLLLEGLSGKVIELWNINSSEYRSVNLRFNFNSGPDRLSTPTMHGFSIGTRVGTGFNATAGGGFSEVTDGVWSSIGGGMPMMYTPTIIQDAFSTSHSRAKFSYPITSVTPYIQDDCSESPDISILPIGFSSAVQLTDGVKTTFEAPLFGYNAVLSYMNPCNVGGMWFDMEFGHHAEDMYIDVADDGDVDYGFTEPAFGAFGRQTNFLLNQVGGVNYATDSASLTLNVNGQAEGGFFLLPMGAEISSADVSFDGVSIRSNTDPNEGFSLSLLAGSQSTSLGDMPNLTIISQEVLIDPMPLKDALNSLLSNPLVAGNELDDFGREWLKFRFSVDSPNASSGTTLDIVDLDIVYNYSTTLTTSDNLDIELNQGIALWNGGSTAQVPIALYTTSGGSIHLSDLDISSSSGYTNTITITDNPLGLYPNGEIYEIVTTHAVNPITGTALSEAWVTFEAPNGYVKLSWSDFMGFSEASDDENYITLESTSSFTDITDGKEITWHIRINPTWDDTHQVRVYSGLTTSNGVNGLPDAILLDPSVGNAVENDAGISEFELQNSIGTAQSLTGAESGQDINLIGKVRLQDIDVAPDPSAYYLVLELKHLNNTDGNTTIEWEEVANRSGTIGGDFNWNVDLGAAAGSETYRFAIRGYEGGDILCPPSQYNPDETCAIPFDISIDTYEPNLLGIQVLNGQVDPNVESNWRTLLDDTWVVPSQTQKVRMSSQDLPNPPEVLTLHYWVQHDHDGTNGGSLDGIPQASEYISLNMSSDGEAPTANYSGEYNDYANEGQDPVGKVSIWVEGYDLAGNPIDGGAPGFENDSVTYVSMSSQSPVIRNFYIEDSQSSRFLNSNLPQWDGEWNQTMYAGNTYHLLVEANDDNGWRDVDYFKIELDDTRDDMTLWYFPRNETAWTESPYIEIVNESEESDGATLRRMDGGALVDPFESDFILDLPIRIDWGVLGETSANNNPTLFMQDLDNPLYRMLPSSGRYIQTWYYSDGIQLDFRTNEAENLMVTPIFEDVSTPITRDVREGFVYAGDTIRFAGQYAYRDGIYDSVYINPEVELTLEITRLDAAPDGAKGYIAYPGEVMTHSFTGGVFDINITAPDRTNEYTYEFKLINLPAGSEDFTPAVCSGSTSYGCSTFNIKVDKNAPRVSSNSWTAKKGETGEVISQVLSTATYHCVDVEVLIEEQEALFPGDVEVAWMFYESTQNSQPWLVYANTFFGGPNNAEPMTETLTLSTAGGAYLGEADCIDMWPLEDGQFDPDQNQMSGVEIVMWIQGVDSAGSSIVLGGGPQDDGTTAPIFSSNPDHKSLYTFIHEEATFSIRNVRLNPEAPEVGQKMVLEVEVENTGSMAGSAELVVKSIINGQTPVTEGIITTESLDVGERAWSEISLEPFGEPTTGMYYTVSVNGTGDVLYDGSQKGDAFNVKVASEDDSSSFLLIIGLLVVALAILGTLVVVFARRGSSGSSLLEDEYEYEDVDAAVESKVLAEIPANVDPEMARAMAEFPQWNQEEIQGYFDQGWNIESLKDWVNNQ